MQFYQLFDSAIKIRLNGLCAVEDIIFSISESFRLRLGRLSFVRQNLVATECEKCVHACGELLHCECVLAIDQILYVVEKACDRPLQPFDFLFLQIVFGDDDVAFQNSSIWCVPPRFQPHVLFGMVST